MKIHEQLALVIKQDGLTQTLFAKKAGLSITCVNQILNGRRNAGKKAARRIELATGGRISAAELLTADLEVIHEVHNA